MCVSCLRYIADYTKATTVNDSMISFSSSSVACKFKELFVKLASSREAHCKYAHNQIVANRTRNFNPCPAVCFAFLCLDAKNNWVNLTECSVLSALCWLRIDSPVADSLQTVINADDDKRTQERQREEEEEGIGNDCLLASYVLWAFHLIGISEIISNIASTTQDTGQERHERESEHSTNWRRGRDASLDVRFNCHGQC